jgi:hypothetical protein
VVTATRKVGATCRHPCCLQISSSESVLCVPRRRKSGHTTLRPADFKLTDTSAQLWAHRRGRPGPTFRRFVHLFSCFVQLVPCCGRTDAEGRGPHSSDSLCPVSESSVAVGLGYCVLTVSSTVTSKASPCPDLGSHRLEGAMIFLVRGKRFQSLTCHPLVALQNQAYRPP